MPAVSKDQAIMMRMAEHAPEKLHERNRGVVKMKRTERGRAALHEFAVTKSKGLPTRAKR